MVWIFWLAVFYIWLGGAYWDGKDYESAGYWFDDVCICLLYFIFWPVNLVALLLAKWVAK